MVGAKEAIQKVEEIVGKINRSESAKKQIAKWISTYDGKIIQWHLGDSLEEKFYVVFTRNGARFETGEYSSPDMVWICDPQVWLDFQSGALDMRAAMKEGKIFIWGSLHEAFPFMMILMTALTEAT